MKNSKLLSLLLILLFAISTQAQNLKQLERIADELKKQTEKLAETTSKNIKKRSVNSEDDLEQAFLAEQVNVSAKLIEKLIDNKRSANELRYSGKILSDMTRRFSRFKTNQEKWQGINNSINNLNRGLRLFTGDKNDDANKKDENSTIVGRVFWRGKVDAEVQLVIRDLNLKVNTISGQTYPDGTHSFTSRLAKDNSLKVGVKKTEGRGNVRVIQQPSVINDYTAIIQINDNDGGAKEYSLEIYWFR